MAVTIKLKRSFADFLFELFNDRGVVVPDIAADVQRTNKYCCKKMRPRGVPASWEANFCQAATGCGNATSFGASISS